MAETIATFSATPSTLLDRDIKPRCKTLLETYTRTMKVSINALLSEPPGTVADRLRWMSQARWAVEGTLKLLRLNTLYRREKWRTLEGMDYSLERLEADLGKEIKVPSAADVDVSTLPLDGLRRLQAFISDEASNLFLGRDVTKVHAALVESRAVLAPYFDLFDMRTYIDATIMQLAHGDWTASSTSISAAMVRKRRDEHLASAAPGRHESVDTGDNSREVETRTSIIETLQSMRRNLTADQVGRWELRDSLERLDRMIMPYAARDGYGEMACLEFLEEEPYDHRPHSDCSLF